MTQCDRILYALQDAGEAGVRSDVFYELGIPRFAARVKELRDAGWEIESAREKQFVRYRIHTSGVHPAPEHDTAPSPGGVDTEPGAPSPAESPAQSLFGVSTDAIPSAYDPYSEAA